MTDFFPILVAGSGGSGGGNNTTSGLFPNGTVFVTASRDFLPTDVGKLLICVPGAMDPDIHLTMPAGVAFEAGEIAVLPVFRTYYNTSNGGALIKPIWQINAGTAIGENVFETIVLSTLPDTQNPGNFLLANLSTAIFNDNGDLKTANKYLLDQITEKVVEIGTIDFNQINALVGVPTSIVLPFTLSGFGYVVAFYSLIETEFDLGAVNSVELSSTIYNSNQPNLDLTDDENLTIFHIENPYLKPNPISDLTLTIDYDLGGGEVNPGNLTQGLIRVKALIKKVPF